MSLFKDKTLMITGGTGSFGNTVLKHFLTSDIGEIRIFSRDEKKQDDMRHDLQARYPDHAKKVRFYVGDVRNIDSIRDAMPGVDYIFHAAALKHVPSQQLPPLYFCTDGILIAPREKMIEWNYFHGTNPYRYILDKRTSIDIDDGLDLACARAWLDMDETVSQIDPFMKK